MNYFKMKNEDLKTELERYNLDEPLNKHGVFDRAAAARLLLDVANKGGDRTKALMSERVVCVIRGDGTETGQQAVFVSVGSNDANIRDYSANIPREVEVDIPAYVFDYLNSLYMKDYIPEYDSVSRTYSVKERKVKRFRVEELDRYIRETE